MKGTAGGRRKRSLIIILTLAMLLGVVPLAQATAILTLSDGSNSVTITDNGAGDTNDLVGVVGYNGALSSNWIVNVTTGITKPILGSMTTPVMHLDSVDVATSGAGSLIITFGDTGFSSPTSGSAMMAIGGITAGSVTYEAFYDDTNRLGFLGPFGSGAFSGALSGGSVPSSTDYSLMMKINIVHKSAGVTSFNADVKVPEPSTLLLLGSGLASLAFFSRRKNKA